MGSSQSQQCGICERTVLNVFGSDNGRDNFLGCHRCGGIYCMECAGLDNNQYATIKSQDNQIDWYCQYCVIEIKRSYEVSY